VSIVVEDGAPDLDLDPDRAVPFGLLVNELVTNAVKHAFPKGEGRVLLRIERLGGQIELTVADDGAGMRVAAAAKLPETRGSDYLAIFVRQLGGVIVAAGAEQVGTTVKIRFPVSLSPPGGAERAAA
jgi:two-component sensor histidine kinase